MFGFGKKTAEELLTEVQEVSTAAPSMSHDERIAYFTKAKELGIYNGAMIRELILSEVSQMGLRVYPMEKVERYLDQVFRKSLHNWRGMKWGWHPLRPADQNRNNFGIHESKTMKRGGVITDTLYQLEVPLPVLESVERISKAVSWAHFYVSGELQPQSADPFLAVGATGMELLVIERWDEPSFRA